MRSATDIAKRTAVPKAWYLLVLVLAGCASPGITTPSPAPFEGVWTRSEDCQGMLAAFEQAGLAESQGEWIGGIWGGQETDPSQPCAAARPARAHTIFFADGGFGSYGASGDREVESEYRVADADTLLLKVRAGFAWDREIVVDYAISSDSATFTIEVPADCGAQFECGTAYAWALSQLYGGTPWQRGN